MRFLMNPYIYESQGPPPPSSVIDLTDLVAYYKLDGDGLDSSGNSHDLTVLSLGVNTNYVAGKYSNGISFSNSGGLYNSYAYAPASADFVKGTLSAFSWVKLDSATDYAIGPIFFTDKWSILIRRADGEIRVKINGTIYATTQLITYGQWNNIGMTMNGSTVKVYYNGSEILSISEVTTDGAAAPLTLGGEYPFEVRAFTGMIDDASIWNRVITPAEVTTLYNSSNPLIY